MEKRKYGRRDNEEPKRCLLLSPYWRQVMVVTTAFNMNFLVGMAMGTNTVAIPQLKRESIEVTEEMRSYLGAVFGFGSLCWIIILTPSINYFGVRKTAMFVSLSPLIGSTVNLFAVTSTQLLLGQAIQSLALGSYSNLLIMVLTEYPSPQNRSLFLTLKSASLFWGIWVANAIGTFFNWRYIAGTSIICSLYSITVFFWPEAPFWLLSKGKLDECADSFRWLRGSDENTELELKKMLESVSGQHFKKSNNTFTKNIKKYYKCVTAREFYIPLFLMFSLFFLYMSTGKMSCTIYSIELLQNMISDSKKAYGAMLILDGINVVGMYCGCYITKKIKRRTLILGTSSVGILFLCLISGQRFLVKFGIISDYPIIPLIFLMIFSFFISIGPMIILPAILCELVPITGRLLFCIIFTMFSQSLFGIFMKMAPYLFSLGHEFAFLIYAGLSSISLLTLFLYLPETLHKTALEISEGFKKPKRIVDECEVKLVI